MSTDNEPITERRIFYIVVDFILYMCYNAVKIMMGVEKMYNFSC